MDWNINPDDILEADLKLPPPIVKNSSESDVAAPLVATDVNSLNFSTEVWDNTIINKLSILCDFSKDPTLLKSLQNLYIGMSLHKKSRGIIAPKGFIAKLKCENEVFKNQYQQDAHEMFNFCINHIAENLVLQSKEVNEKLRLINHPVFKDQVTDIGSPAKTWINSLFEGLLTNETRCLNCESVLYIINK
jgi:ubiquitin C-terminal hydrolase